MMPSSRLRRGSPTGRKSRCAAVPNQVRGASTRVPPWGDRPAARAEGGIMRVRPGWAYLRNRTIPTSIIAGTSSTSAASATTSAKGRRVPRYFMVM